MKVLVADDEPLARQRLRTLLAAEPNVELVAEAESGADTVRRVLALSPDVLLLDVEMPAGGGFEVLRAVPPESLPVVVFVTAWQCYALQAFEAQALDFLLKPYDKERFRAALARVRELEPLSQREYLLLLGAEGTAVRTGRSHRARVEAAMGLIPEGAGSR
nr:response regulator [Comamonas sp. JC664]